MVIRDGIAGMIGASIRLLGLALFLYGATLMSATNPPHDPYVMGVGGLAVFVFIGPLVKSVIKTVLLVD